MEEDDDDISIIYMSKRKSGTSNITPESTSSETSSDMSRKSGHRGQGRHQKYSFESDESPEERGEKDYETSFSPSSSGFKGSREKGKRTYRSAATTSSESVSSEPDRRSGFHSHCRRRKCYSPRKSKELPRPKLRAEKLWNYKRSFQPSTSKDKVCHKKGTRTFHQTAETTSSESESSSVDRPIGYRSQGRFWKKSSSIESDEISPKKRLAIRNYDASLLPSTSKVYKGSRKEGKATLEDTRFQFEQNTSEKSKRRPLLTNERARDYYESHKCCKHKAKRPHSYEESPKSSKYLTKKPYDYETSSVPSTSKEEDNHKRLKVSPDDIGFQFKEKSPEALFPMRPGSGEKGRHINVVSNCYPLKFPTGYVYHYDIEIIDINPRNSSDSGHKKYRCLNTKRNREVVTFMLEHNPEFQGLYGAFDGQKNLLTKGKLNINLPFRCTVMLPDKSARDDLEDKKYDNFKVKILSLVSKINLDSLQDFYRKKCNDIPQEAITALQIILRHDPCLKLTPIGRSLFYPPDFRSLTPFGGGLEIWFGYHQSIRLGQWKPTVNLDVSATIFWEAGPVLNYIADYMKMSVRDLRKLRTLNKSNIGEMSRKLKQTQVKVTHLSYRRKYRVIGLRDLSANQEYIECMENDGHKTHKSVAQYFKDTYGKDLEFGNLPCLHVQPKKRNIFMPIEVCEFIEGQHYKGELTPAQKSKMIEYTSHPPHERFEKIQDVVNTADINRSKVVKGFGIEISNRPLIAEARVLDSPNLVYKDRYNSEKTVLPRDGAWDVRNTQFFQGAVISRWVLLSFYRCPNLDTLADLINEIGRNLGLQLGELSDIMEKDVNCDKKKLFKYLKEKGNELAIIILPKVGESEGKRFYAEIKKIAETEIGLRTQCIKAETFRGMTGRRGPQIANNLCLKINAKLGGENHSLYERDMPRILFKPIIIIGADVNHPAPTQQNQPSIAACVGSLDCIGKRFGVSIRAQMHSKNQKKVEEIITLEDMVYDLLLAFYKHTKRQRPEKIIFYRDGVSDGELLSVKNKEVVSIRKACQRLNEDYQPGITVIVVQKRHHVRFRPMDRRDGAGRKGNIPPGTVIDTHVTHPVNFDFFLCSQFGLQGTSRPSHYFVVEDDNNFSADELQKLTFHMCHMYVRCTKSISIPAPVAYADLVAYRARTHLDCKKRDSRFSGDYSRSYRLTQDDINAIEVVKELKNSMYFV